MAEENAKKSETAKREEEVLQFWQKNNIFEKSLKKDSPEGEFVFYDGPPFATGLPHYGSLLSSIIKDVIPRYKTMRGYHVRRRWGWDCHGLPIENMIEKELGLKDKTEIEKIGLKKFNQACHDSVLRYAHDWKDFVDRVGRFVEYDNAYMTMDSSYTESVWWALKEAYKKDLLYEGRKVLLYCPHCETPIAKAEVQMDNSYKDVTEEAVTVKFKLKSDQKFAGNKVDENTYVLAWTTTPWTLPGNVALAIGKDVEYALVDLEGDKFILAKDLVSVNTPEAEIKDTFKGSELVGLEYEPLYEIDKVKSSGKKAWYIAPAPFVTTEDGTGVVHTAVIYGEDDYALGVELDLPMVPLLDEKGHFTSLAPDFIQGEYFKKAEKAIKEDLEKLGLLYKKEPYTHSYPHCHRCGTALLYNAITSWFINIQKIKKRLIELNEKVNWVPDYLKHGRFLNIVEGAPDWTISRNRYWASPLPIWKCGSCNEIDVVGSLDELKQKNQPSNVYWIMRHGEAEHNLKNVLSSAVSDTLSLTEKGKKEAGATGLMLKEEGIDLVISSPLLRTKDTAEIVRKSIGLPEEAVVVDERLREIGVGDLNGKSVDEYHKLYKNHEEKFYKNPPAGENLAEVKDRLGELLYELEKQYSGKKILLVTHEYPTWLLFAVKEGANPKEAVKLKGVQDDFIKTSDALPLEFYPIPHNDKYELDYHRPYIDEIKWNCECGGTMERIPEVVDGWVESASMPFAEYHYPFENKETFESRFPGDFVAEYIAQTRTWFYYMMVMSTLLFDDISFKNVVSTGTILAADGSKMSKSKGNYTDPMENMDMYGADALRYYLMTSVVMQAEDLRFSDTEVKEAHNRFLNMLWNSFKFYDMYGGEYDNRAELKTENVLDKWILAKLKILASVITENLDKFDTVKAGRPIKDFVADFSQWYIRRSRDRFKSQDENDRNNSMNTTGYVLLELSKLIAPFTPYIAENIYQQLGKNKESVHLEDWPEYSEITKEEKKIIEMMEEVRKISSMGLEARSSAGIKVRQPLSKIKIKNSELEGKDEYLEIIKEEVNIKDVVFDKNITEEVELDTELTLELKEEGELRDLLRELQSMRKDLNLNPEDEAVVNLGKEEKTKKLFEKYESDIRGVANVVSVRFDSTDGEGIEMKKVD